MRMSLLSFLLLFFTLACRQRTDATNETAAVKSVAAVPSGCFSIWDPDEQNPDNDDFRGRLTKISGNVAPLNLPAPAAEVCFARNNTLGAWEAMFSEEAKNGDARKYTYRGPSGFNMKPANCPSSKTCRQLTIKSGDKDVQLFFVASKNGNWHLTVGPGGISRQYTLIPQND